ncbi:uncharacterized protein TA13045 [Theileria annulata]|uniref:Alpha-carbonic anhydrase domain-containing protein n=1 Tax=Theileria annulata TaxID=5874 RepID=Q4UEB7_THEAN|nr:uncharacterized protein TA13045 [Theileria annulata]CAI74572.1 hypothetical protein, conserved [Theileria annulata]|eukprot:XP_952304.1 hypothetical protein, conserved [Theileria annulata]
MRWNKCAKSILILVFLSTKSLLKTCECQNNGNHTSKSSNTGNSVPVAFTHVQDSNSQSTSQTQENIKQHNNYTPLTFTGSKVPAWDYGRHGSDWTHGMCSAGLKQSPVDLHVEGLVEDLPFNLKEVYDSVLRGESPDLKYNSWKRGDMVLRSPNVFRITVPQNEGSTFGALFTTDKPNLYMATHIDFHSPSEHTFDGSANRRQIEVQIWHYLSDAPSSDLGIGSIDSPETTDVNILITKAVKKTPNTGTTADTTTTGSTKATATTSSDSSTSNSVEVTKGKDVDASGVKNVKSVDLSHLNLHTVDSSKDNHLNTDTQHDTSSTAKSTDYTEDDHPEFYYEADDHPSMVQLSEDLHPLNSGKSSSYKKLLENDRYDLFNKYLLTHLNNSANNLNSEQVHIREKKMAREKGTHWGRWAVISLTFMSEEIEKTNIESLKTFPSERFMSEVFKAGSSVTITENDNYLSVGDLNTNHVETPLPVVDLDTPLNLSSLFMMLEVKNVNYFAYDGSFTQPGCEETVRWYVAKESLPISTELMLQLHRMLNPNPHVQNPNNYVDNYRELQNVNNKCRNVGKVRFVHGYPMEYFVISPFSHEHQVSAFRLSRLYLVFIISILLMLY